MDIGKKILIVIGLIVASPWACAAQDMRPITEFGAKMDGNSDDSDAIQRSLKELNYAYFPQNGKTSRINKTIYLKGNQKLFGLTRGSKLISYVPANEFAIVVSDVSFGESVEINDIALSIFSPGAGGIKIINSRNVFISNILITGENKAGTGILIDGGDIDGSAWNQISTYTILKCGIGIEMVSRTKRNWCNRNFVDFGVIQSCGTAIKLDRASTNRLLANPQGCKVGFQLINSHYNQIESFEENSAESSVVIDKLSRHNTFTGEFSTKKIMDKGVDNNFILNKKKQKLYDGLQGER